MSPPPDPDSPDLDAGTSSETPPDPPSEPGTDLETDLETEPETDPTTDPGTEAAPVPRGADTPDLPPSPPEALGPPGTHHGLRSEVITVWRLQGLFRAGAFFLPLVVTVGFFARDVLPTAAVAILGAAVLVLAVAHALVWPVLAHRHFRFAVRRDDLWVRRGVLYRQETVVPLTRIQHVDTRQGPLERLLHLSRVVVFTASGMAPDTGIPGLAPSLADTLRDYLALRGGDDGL